MERERFRDVSWAEKRPKDTASGWSQGVSLRALRGGRQGFAFANEISAASVSRLWQQARDMAALMPADRHRRLPRPAAAQGAAEPEADDFFAATVKDLQGRLGAYEKTLLSSDRRLKKALRLAFRESLGEFAVVNTEGTAVDQPFGSVSFAAELMGEMKKEVQVSWDSAETRSWRGLDCGRVLDRARAQLLRSFGAGPIPAGSWPVVFSPRVGVEFLELFSEALSAENVQRGQSFLAGKKGRALLSPLVNLLDDGRYPGGVASGRYDAEGQPTRRAALVEKGVLKDFLYDSAAASREGRAAAGNAGRGGIQGPPAPDASNFYMLPGEGSAEELYALSPRAFLLQDVMGMHTADPVSGDFSLGATGLLLEKGRVVRAVKGVTLAGNLLDLFKKVDAVAGDLTWYGAAGAPTFRASGLSVGS